MNAPDIYSALTARLAAPSGMGPGSLVTLRAVPQYGIPAVAGARTVAAMSVAGWPDGWIAVYGPDGPEIVPANRCELI